MNRYEVILNMNFDKLIFNSIKYKELTCDFFANIVASTIKSKKLITISYSLSSRYTILKSDQTSKFSSVRILDLN